MKREQGFGTAEMLMSVIITLVLLAATMGSLNDALGMNEQSSLMADLSQNMRSGMNFLVNDFMNAGWGIPIGGIPIPSGTGITAVTRPGPPGTSLTFAGDLTIAAVNPGDGLGPSGDGRATDTVNILYADNLLPLNQTTLAAIATDGSSATANAGIPITGTGISYPIRVGDLIAFSNAVGNTMQYVTRVSGQTMFFDSGDPLHLNQPAATQGSITQLKSGGVFPPTTATRVYLVTYYLDTTTDPTMPRLIRRLNNDSGQTVALVLEDLQLTYDLVDGVTNPTNISTPVSPNSPNQIRRANIYLSGRSSLQIRKSQDFLRTNLTTQVSLRSLSFVNRYN